MSFEDNDIYEDRVLDYNEDLTFRGHCDRATHAHEDDNPMCGDEVRIELEIDKAGRILQGRFDGDGCRVSQAAAAMLMERMDGATVDDVKNFSAKDMIALYGPRLGPNRQKCCLLSWRVLQSAIYSPAKSNGDDTGASAKESS